MLTRSQRIAEADLHQLHVSAIRDAFRIRGLLRRVEEERVVLRRGMNRKIDPETAVIERLEEDALVLKTRDFEPDRRAQVFLNFAIDGLPYFFAAPRLATGRKREGELLLLGMPSAVYRADRRDRARVVPEADERGWRHVLVSGLGPDPLRAKVVDYSPAGLRIEIPGRSTPVGSPQLAVRYLDGPRAGREFYAQVRHGADCEEADGGTRLGLELAPEQFVRPLGVVRRDRVLDSSWPVRIRQRLHLTTQAGVVASKQLLRNVTRSPRHLPDVRVVDYENDRGENIVAIVNSFGNTRGAPAVVIPPAWGRTKETLLPLADAVVATFRAARRPVTVIRFDGIRKRGESYNDPDCREPGKDHYHFTFQQGVDDIVTTLDFLERSSEFQPSTSILVTFSAASIEGRRVAKLEGRKRIGGWVCVVGAPDIQSMMRIISGGVDYAAGFERGVRFGLQELLGVVVDIDHAGANALEKELTFLEDARRDFSEIDIPITWYHGEHDAWMNLNRVRDVLAYGDTSRRQLIQVPTGHQLKSSWQALELFEEIAVEIGRMATGETLRPVLPDLATLEARRRAERRRRPSPAVDIRGFWRDYLVGRDGAVGIELMTDKSAYRELIASQVHRLHLHAGDRVADLGSGTGSLPLAVVSSVRPPLPLEIHELDYVREALERARERLDHAHKREGLVVRFIEADLDLGDRGRFIPLISGTYDAVMASLLLSYVANPDLLLREIRRLLRPGGRLVVSSLRCDADMSKLWADGLAEHWEAVSRAETGDKDPLELEAAGRVFLNDAARLLDFEESGMFRFWEADDLARLLRRAGFRKIETSTAFGDPPQALVLAAESP